MNPLEKAGHAVRTRILAALIGMAGSFILFAAYLVVPPAGIFTGLLAPLPVAFVRIQHGRWPAFIAVLGGTAAMTAVFGITAGFFYLVQCGVISLVMTELLERGFSGARALVWTTASNLALLAALVLFFTLSSGQNLHTVVTDEIHSSVSQAVSIYEKGGVKGDDLVMLKQTMATASELVIRIYPALVTITLIAMAGCNLALLRRFTAIGKCSNIGEFREYRNPELIVWLLIVSGFSLLAGDWIITTPALNVLAVTLLLYFLQGLAVLLTVISRQSIAGVLRIGLYAMLILQPYLAGLVAALGVFDLWGDFRTPRKQENL
jgi:uncharacterized protein YybS (DUF2232 family)